MISKKKNLWNRLRSKKLSDSNQRLKPNNKRYDGEGKVCFFFLNPEEGYGKSALRFLSFLLYGFISFLRTNGPSLQTLPI